MYIVRGFKIRILILQLALICGQLLQLASISTKYCFNLSRFSEKGKDIFRHFLNNLPPVQGLRVNLIYLHIFEESLVHE